MHIHKNTFPSKSHNYVLYLCSILLLSFYMINNSANCAIHLHNAYSKTFFFLNLSGNNI